MQSSYRSPESSTSQAAKSPRSRFPQAVVFAPLQAAMFTWFGSLSSVVSHATVRYCRVARRNTTAAVVILYQLPFVDAACRSCIPLSHGAACGINLFTCLRDPTIWLIARCDIRVMFRACSSTLSLGMLTVSAFVSHNNPRALNLVRYRICWLPPILDVPPRVLAFLLCLLRLQWDHLPIASMIVPPFLCRKRTAFLNTAKNPGADVKPNVAVPAITVSQFNHGSFAKPNEAKACLTSCSDNSLPDCMCSCCSHGMRPPNLSAISAWFGIL